MLDAAERRALEQAVGRRLVAFSQAESPDRREGEWADDEPLVLEFDDGATLVVTGHGFHQSGSLSIWREEATSSAP